MRPTRQVVQHQKNKIKKMVGIPQKAWQSPSAFISALPAFATLQKDRETLERVQQRLTEGASWDPQSVKWSKPYEKICDDLSIKLKMSVSLLNVLKKLSSSSAANFQNLLITTPLP